MQFSKERALVLTAATAAFGAASLLRKLAVDRMPPIRFQIASSLVYTLTIPLFILITAKYEKDIPTLQGGTFWMVLATIVGIFGNILFGYALRASSEVGVTTTLASSSPIITMMLAFLFIGERPTIQSAIGCAVVILGIIIISMR